MKTVTKVIIIGWSLATFVGLVCTTCSGLSGVGDISNSPGAGLGVILGLLLLLVFWGFAWGIIAVPALVVNVISK